MREVIHMLAFLGALRNYSYIDRIGNAIDEVTVEEALKDAIRAYISQCIESRQECIEIEENIGLKCPELSSENLERSIGIIVNEMKKSKAELLKTSRTIALEAYASIPRIREEHKCVPKR